MTRERYLEAFSLAGREIQTERFDPADRIEAAAAVYLMIGAGLSTAEAAEITGWDQAEVSRMCGEVMERCDRDRSFDATMTKLVRAFKERLGRPA